ncbi:hypothetical protein AB3662_43665 [Sorangium cellulosum]|uniref:hypothetical protein n=1 Tax=Sorangium cellulosum TaxID=56 RepID=UPI003D9A105B
MLHSMIRVAVLSLGVTLVGCVAETADAELDHAVAAEEETGEARQALETCTPLGSGGGTWGDILTLCSTPDRILHVRKRDGSAFTSSGTMSLNIWIGEILSTTVYPGARSVYFGQLPPGDYYAIFESNVGGEAYTGTLTIW